MTRRQLLAGTAAQIREYPDIRTVPADLVVPPLSDGVPAPGRRVKQTAPEYRGTSVYHVLYLPTGWKPGKTYPVIVEYAGNGNYRNDYGDVSLGVPEGSNLGYGVSGGKDFIWICLPYISEDRRQNQILWWGDVAATLDYCRLAIRRVCDQYGGDEKRVVLAGFSRGSIGCNYLGLHNDEIAPLWCAFICYSHYDGVRTNWPYKGVEREAALTRLRRLHGRPQFICHERSVDETRQYLGTTRLSEPWDIHTLPFRNHNDAWTLRDIPLRRTLREWLTQATKS